LKIISLSGSASTPFLHNDRKPSVYAKALYQNISSKTKATDKEVTEYLRSIPAKIIVQRTTLFKGICFTLFNYFMRS